LSPPHPLTNFEIEKYYEKEPQFQGVFSRNSLPTRSKDGGYVVNLDDLGKPGTHWVAIFIQKKNAVYFDSFGVEKLPKEIKRFLHDKNLNLNLFRIQEFDSIMCGYFCLGFLDYMFAGKNLLDYTSLFSPNDFKKNDKIIKDLFQLI